MYQTLLNLFNLHVFGAVVPQSYSLTISWSDRLLRGLVFVDCLRIYLQRFQ